MVLHCHHAPPWFHLLPVLFFIMPEYFWLIVECKIINPWPSKATMEYIFNFFHRSNHLPKRCYDTNPRIPPRPPLLYGLSHQ